MSPTYIVGMLHLIRDAIKQTNVSKIDDFHQGQKYIPVDGDLVLTLGFNDSSPHLLILDSEGRVVASSPINDELEDIVPKTLSHVQWLRTLSRTQETSS